ncbi:MAG: CpXC domain-containing protein [Prevotella sp.]|nr:CpXC domain-containing protein [Prevotella sp.]
MENISKVRKEAIVCPHCHTKGVREIWDSVNVDLNPELRAKIFSDELFLYQCRKCGWKSCFVTKTIYHDMTHNFTLFFEFFKPKDFDYEHINVPSLPTNDNHIYRHVTGLWRLKEKILILEKGLNDIAIERMKYMFSHVLHPELAEKRTEIFFGDIRHLDGENSDDGQIIFWFHNDKDETEHWSAPMHIYYEHCLACKLDSRMSVKTCMNVDEGFMAIRMKKVTV